MTVSLWGVLCRRGPRAGLAAVCLSSLLSLGTGLSHAAESGDPAVREYWMETRLADTPTGYLREQVRAVDGNGWATELESKLVMTRMSSRVEIRSLVHYVEQADGQLRHVAAEVSSSAETTKIEGDVIDGVLQLRSTAGGRTYETKTTLQRPLLGPQGIRERSRQTLRKPGDRLEYATFVGEFATIAAVVREVVGSETLSLDGASVPTVQVRETLDVMPVATTYWLDGEGRPVRSRQESPFGTIDNLSADAGVQARVAAGAELPEETYQNAVARSNIRLPRPRSLEQVRVRIDLKRADSVMPALDGPDQTVVERSDRHAVIEMRRGTVPTSRASNEGVDAKAWLGANAYLQSDHPEVVKLARSLRRPGLDPYAQARVLQDWVATEMTFDAGVALVSASEAVRDRRGTCLAYAVVLTTLARALDIPSRVVMGYVYAANMWGGHAWTEVLVDGRWLALDAAVWRAGTADAARIGVIRTSLEQGQASGLASLAQLYGNERIRVLGYTLDGHAVTVPDDAATQAVDTRDYRNDWLGVRFRAPKGYTFAEVDIMYPRSEIAVLRNATGAEIAIGQRSVRPGEANDLIGILRSRGFPSTEGAEPVKLSVAGRPARIVDHDGKVEAVWVDDSDLWYVRGKGDHVGEAMRELLKDFRLQPASR